jgi:carboxylate-amine ligase
VHTRRKLNREDLALDRGSSAGPDPPFCQMRARAANRMTLSCTGNRSCQTVRMTVTFHSSARSSVGIEWELMLADGASGDLVGRAGEVISALAEQTALERFTVTEELLTNTIEVTSGIGDTVEAAVDDIADAIRAVRTVTDPLGIELLCAGSHPFAQWYEQSVTDKTRYHTLIERTQWWGRNMMIWGIHVHIGVEDVDKVLPIVNALAVYLPHLQALSASSPYWAGERTGYASNRALVFQQLPTAGLPWPLQTWAEYEGYLEDMVRTGVMEDATEVRWDIRPAPRWGTIEVRACDGMSTLPELAAVAALTQTLVEHFSRELDAGRELPTIQPWFVRENKWRAARYGLGARVITDREGTQVPVSEHLAQTIERLAPIAAELHCAREFAGLRTILEQGASSTRQLLVADAAGGDLRAVVQHLIREFRAGPTLREHLAGVRDDIPAS